MIVWPINLIIMAVTLPKGRYCNMEAVIIHLSLKFVFDGSLRGIAAGPLNRILFRLS